MRVLIATDAWHPQINGVVRSLENVATRASLCGAETSFLTPQPFRTLPLPSYGEIRLAIAWRGAVERLIQEARPDYIHIATEGPIGLVTRRLCLKYNRHFTTSYHTRFPEYVSARAPVPPRLTYALLRRFHNAGAGVMVSSPTLDHDLRERGFRNIMRWSRGVDAELFRPRVEKVLDLPRPIYLFVGRVAVEKNLTAFLSLDLPGSKVIVGDGPQRASLEAAYPDAHFLGAHAGEALAKIYSSADVFVFPSLTDTFGIVLLEALASGLPIAAFPVMGPRDVLGHSGAGVLDDDLRSACLRALDIPADLCRAHGETFTWEESARQFFDNIRIAHNHAGAASAA